MARRAAGLVTLSVHELARTAQGEFSPTNGRLRLQMVVQWFDADKVEARLLRQFSQDRYRVSRQEH